MEKPKNCAKCPFNKDFTECEKNGRQFEPDGDDDDWIWDRRAVWCPLKEEKCEH